MKKHISDSEIDIEIVGELLTLDCEKTVFWKEKGVLMLSDPHFGKVSHFRKKGIAIPSSMIEANYNRLEFAISKYGPEKVFILGDMFHSYQNHEWELLKDFFASYDDLDFHLIIGNHDIIRRNELLDGGLTVHDHLKVEPFILSHYPLTEPHASLYNLAGHLHPSVRLRGGPGQSMRFPCFYFNSHLGVLPAFGDFTGHMKLRPRKGDTVVAIAKNQLVMFE